MRYNGCDYLSMLGLKLNHVSKRGPKGFKLFAFDLSADLDDGGHFQLVKQGNLRLELHFKTALPETINVIVYAEFDNVIEVRQKYLDFYHICTIYTEGSKVETQVASAYVCPYGTRGYRVRDDCSIFTAEVEAINKALTYVTVSTRKSFVIFSDSMSVLQAIESQESKNPLVNRVLQACQKILSNGKFITFCWLPSHKDIRGNEDVDRAAKDALSKAQPENF